MLIIFFDIQGIVHKEFVPPGQTINGFEAAEEGHLAQTSRQVEEKPIGFSTMTTYPLTHHSLFNNSWPPKTLQ